MTYPMVIYSCEEGGFVAEVPALRGCSAQGETLEETLQELMIVRSLWLETANNYGQKLPEVENAIALSKNIKCDRVMTSHSFNFFLPDYIPKPSSLSEYL